jgi:hypothetical protein
MSWEIFERKSRRGGEPLVTFNKLGRISLNKKATVKMEKDAVENVLLMWDGPKRQIGIRPISKKDPRAYRVAYGKKGNGAGFSAKTFLDHIGYSFKESRAFSVAWDESEAMFIAEVPADLLGLQPQLTLDRQPAKLRAAVKG